MEQPPSKSWSIHTRRDITARCEILERAGAGIYSDVYKAHRRSNSTTFDPLEHHLSTKNLRQADEETRRLIIALAGDAAVKRGYVFFSEVKFIAADDLRAIDALWRQHSDGRLGYSVQRKIWKKSNRLTAWKEVPDYQNRHSAVLVLEILPIDLAAVVKAAKKDWDGGITSDEPIYLEESSIQR